METSSLTARSAGSAPDCAFAAGNNPRNDVASLARADIAEAAWAVKVADTLAAISTTGFAGSSRLSRPTAPAHSSLSPL